MSATKIQEAKDGLANLLDRLVDLTEAEIKTLSSKIEELEEKNEVLLEEIEELKEESLVLPDGFSKNIISMGTLSDLFENLNRIPISEIESLVNKYKI